jgi:hypothetical protein
LGVLRDSGHEHLSGSLVIPVLDHVGEVVQLYGRKIPRSDIEPFLEHPKAWIRKKAKQALAKLDA